MNQFLRYFRFRLRTFFLIVTILCLVIGCWNAKWRARQAQLEFIQKLDGYAVSQVYCDSEGMHGFPYTQTGLFNRIKNDIGAPFSEIVHVDLRSAQLSPDDLERLSKLDQIIYINLSHTNISDQEMSYLATFKALRFVDLSSSKVTRKGVEDLKRLNPEITIEEDIEYTELSKLFDDFQKEYDASLEAK